LAWLGQRPLAGAKGERRGAGGRGMMGVVGEGETAQGTAGDGTAGQCQQATTGKIRIETHGDAPGMLAEYRADTAWSGSCRETVQVSRLRAVVVVSRGLARPDRTRPDRYPPAQRRPVVCGYARRARR